MSDNGREESSGGGGGRGGSGDDERQLLLPPPPPPPPSPPPEQQKRKAKSIRKVKHLLRLPFRNSDKWNSRQIPSPLPPPIDLYDEELGKKGCYLCFMPPRTLPESSVRPNNSRSSSEKPPPYYEYLKSMLEKNDYYSAECNVHRDTGDAVPEPEF